MRALPTPLRPTRGRLFSTLSSLTGGRGLPLTRFDLERFPGWTTVPTDRQLSCSDVEPLTLKDLLARASPAALARWEDLSLAYPDDSRGDASLREAIAAAYEADRETEDRVAGGRGRAGPTQAEEVTVCVPAEGILLAMLALVGRGDRVVVAAPHYQSLGEIAKALGATIVEWTPRIDASGACGGGGSGGGEAGGWGGSAGGGGEGGGGSGGGYRFHTADLEALVRGGSGERDASLVVWNFPHNPTGALPTAEEYEDIVGVCARAGARIFSDEM